MYFHKRTHRKMQSMLVVKDIENMGWGQMGRNTHG